MWTILLTFAMWSGGSTRTAAALSTTTVGNFSSVAVCEAVAKQIVKPPDNGYFWVSKTAQCIQVKG